jgi:methylglutaconyl-CoA hydratase
VTASGPLLVERDGALLRVTLARPERRNALDAALMVALTEAFSDVGDARAVILAGEGTSFCAGADIEWQRASVELSPEQNEADVARMYEMYEAVDRCPAPVVARVQGYALGGGTGLAACADIPIAGADAVFGFSEVRLGMIPAAISPFVLRRIGAGAARRYFTTGERIDAQTALRIGLVSVVAEDLDAAVDAVVESLLASGPQAVRAAKQLVLEPATAVDAPRRSAEQRATPEGQEGFRAFLEKRPPAWRESP